MRMQIAHHTMLQKRGGATRVALLLQHGLAAGGMECAHSFEVAEDAGSQSAPSAASWPERLHGMLARGALAHLHTSEQWEQLLQLCSEFSQRPVLTLHDASLLTGGCPYPLDCPHFERNCKDPCPRLFPCSEARRTRLRELVLSLDPLLVSPSSWLKKLARRSLGQVPVRVIPNGVPWPENEPDKMAVRKEARQAFGLAENARLVMFVAHGGTQAAYKSGDAWERLWHDLKKQAPDAVCFMIGGSGFQQRKDLLAFPYLPAEKLREIMAAADALVYPTRADNHPLVVLEAMAAGCPVVSYAVGGVGEQLEDGQTGRLVPAGDEAALIRAALSVLGTRGGRVLARNAWTRGRDIFSSDRMVADYLRLYAKQVHTKEG